MLSKEIIIREYNELITRNLNPVLCLLKYEQIRENNFGKLSWGEN